MKVEMCEIDAFWHVELESETMADATRLVRMGIDHLSFRKAGDIYVYAGKEAVTATIWIRKQQNALTEVAAAKP